MCVDTAVQKIKIKAGGAGKGDEKISHQNIKQSRLCEVVFCVMYIFEALIGLSLQLLLYCMSKR